MRKQIDTAVISVAPRRGLGTLRLGDGDDIVVVDGVIKQPTGPYEFTDHILITLVTEGYVTFDYDGQTVSLQKDDVYMCMKGSTCSNFSSSPDFNCRQIWFSESELWTISAFSTGSLTDFVALKVYPKVHLSGEEVKRANEYFNLLCHQLRSPLSILCNDIVRALLTAVTLHLLSYMRRELGQDRLVSTNHQIADKFVQLLEGSKGCIRTVAYFAEKLNVTGKQLNKIVKDAIGRTPSQLIQLYTRKAIEYHLRYTDMSVKEVAAALAFPNESFFGRYVKDQLGLTPLEFRRKYRNQ